MSIFDKIKKGLGSKEQVAKPALKAKVSVASKKSPVKKTVKSVPAKAKVKSNAKQVAGILIKPMITEKATELSQFNQYVFEVALTANKVQISQAIEGRYHVKPIRVNVLNHPGKTVRFGRNIGRTRKRRKAIITLAKGQNIKIHEGA
jgi:large subunit ribosomal protein L23